MTKINGNIESVKNSILEKLEEYIDNVYSPGEFLPEEIRDMLCWATCETKREIAVYMDRKNRVLGISIGDSKTVELPELTKERRGEKRLSGVRLWHTHPGGSPLPSEVDINSLKTMRLDAMGVVAVSMEAQAVSGLSVTILKRDEKTGEFTDTELAGPFKPLYAARFNYLFDELVLIDSQAAAYSVENLEKGQERAIIAGVILQGDNVGEEPLAELGELAKTAGATVVAAFTQKREAPDSKYYIGRGLAEEIALARQAKGADIVIFDDELSASCIRNLEDVIGARVIDRTTLILDIFAQRAKSREGRLQVELAQQKYRLPRLMGQGTALSRLGGGIGTRGPGETKLQSDRRHIRRRINYLEEQLREVSERRGVMRKERTKKGLPVIAVVGYTNAGKSTLVNALCDADVFAEDMLFATLDPSVRKLVTPEKQDFLLVDTVGFIKKLPHDLVEAFKSTLEEVVYADLLLHVVDGSSPDADAQIHVVEGIIEELGAGGRPQYLVINKVDLAAEHFGGAGEDTKETYVTKRYPRTYFTSAKTGEGLEELRNAVTEFFTRVEKKFELVIPYSDGKKLSYLHDNGTILEEEYRGDGVYVKGRIPRELWIFGE